MVDMFYDTKIYQQTAKITINNHFVNKVSTTFFENEENTFFTTLFIKQLQSAPCEKEKTSVKLGR